MWISIDPGTEVSAVLFFDPGDGSVVLPNEHTLTDTGKERRGIVENSEVLKLLDKNVQTPEGTWVRPSLLVIEMIASYGMPVGREVFETCVHIGRFIERFGRPHKMIYRMDVKSGLCHSAKASDANVHAVLMDLYGPGKQAVGTKKNPGPLYGIVKDLWSALAVAVTNCKLENGYDWKPTIGRT